MMGSNLGEQEAKWDHGRFSPIGERSALTTVIWKNLRPEGSLARQWRQSYNVVRFAERWRIQAATFHLSVTRHQ
jgi:hypothetical protein